MDEYLQINHCDSPSNKMNDKNCVIVSVDGEKSFDKIWHPFTIKNLSTS